MLRNTDSCCTPYNGRIYVFLCDDGQADIWPHGVVVCPENIKDKETALRAIDKIFEEVTKDDDEWNYDDVHDRLKQLGFDLVEPAYWVEGEYTGGNQ